MWPLASRNEESFAGKPGMGINNELLLKHIGAERDAYRSKAFCMSPHRGLRDFEPRARFELCPPN